MTGMKSYTIHRASGPLRGACDDPAWEAAERLAIDEYPWYVSGDKQDTTVALLYDDEALHALFVCADKHISAVETEPNGNVYLDSCVELFAWPGQVGEGGYFNFEANCCGTVHLGYGPGRSDRRLAPPSVHERIAVATCIPTPTKDESPNDDGWWLAATIPFAALGELTGTEIAPGPGSTWRANFYRCGGKTDDQYACWNVIDFERPSFHLPEFFGELIFE